MSPEDIERILADFRVWLESEPAAPMREVTDLAAIVAQFTALRHEVNLQTKATRAVTEQATKLLETKEDEAPHPVVKAFLDIADVLAVSEAQVRKLPDAVSPLLKPADNELPPSPLKKSSGLFGRLFGSSTRTHEEWTAWAQAIQDRDASRQNEVEEMFGKLTALADSAADGYAMSLRRVERAFPDLGLEPIDCLGRDFDPDTMEVVDMGGEGEPGTVTAEIRRGYRCNGKILRYAQVRVARSEGIP